MEASGLVSGSTRKSGHRILRLGGSWIRDWQLALAISSSLLLLAFCLLVAFRRFSGGLQSAPDAPALIAVGLLLAALAAAVHYGSQMLSGRRSSVYHLVQGLLPLGLAISIFSVCVPGSSPVGVLVVLGIIGTEELFWIARPFKRRVRSESRQSILPPTVAPRPPKEQGPAVDDFFSDFPSEVIRRIERTRGPVGEDICWGQVRSDFHAGQRTASIHLAFCPPFAVNPTLHFEQIEGPEASVKATQVLPYGARLEVRLARTESTPAETRIEFSAIVESDDAL